MLLHRTGTAQQTRYSTAWLKKRIEALYPPREFPEFHLTSERAIELSSLSPVARYVELQDAYNAYLLERRRIEAGALVVTYQTGRHVARQWDKRGSEFMAAAQAEYERALRAGRAVA
jgi:hypothetical protein